MGNDVNFEVEMERIFVQTENERHRMTQAQQLTHSIAALPEPMRALIAGAVAWKFAPSERLAESAHHDKALVEAWRPLWDMSRVHPGERGFEWPSTSAVYRALRRVGVGTTAARSMIAGYVQHDETVLATGRYNIDNSRHPARRETISN
jgi:hypothetical protein